MFTVADFLKLSEIQDIRLLAGAGGVGRIISRTSFIDNPDTFDWMTPGEFVLSTGYLFPEGEDQQRRILQQMVEIGCSGLAVKTNRYLREIPLCMIEEADALDFPLLELPYGHSLASVADITNRHLYQIYDEKMARPRAIQRQLNIASIRPDSLHEIARVSVAYMGNPVLILDSNWRLLAWEDCPQNPYPLRESLTLKRKAAVLPQEFIESIPDTLDRFRKPITRRYSLENNNQIICRVVPVSVYDSSTYGYIVVWETVRTLDAADYIALEQVAVSVAIERIRARENEEAKVRSRREFFDDLLSGNFESLSAARAMAELHGLRSDTPYRCLLVRYARDSAEERIAPQKLGLEGERCMEICLHTAKELCLSVMGVPYSAYAVLLLASPAGERESEKQARRYAEALYDALAAQFSPKSFIIVGVSADDITQIPETYRDLHSIAKILRGSTTYPPIIFAEDYSAVMLLEKYVDRKNLADFVRKTLGALEDYDRENHSRLLMTLDVYFSKSGNITEVAKQMYIHRNTCIYRMEKIKAILQDDFSNPMKLLNYQVALWIMKFLNL